MQHGNTIEISAGVVGIDEACSGIRSFQATLMISLFLGELYRLSPLRRTILCLSGFAMSFLFNLGRTLLLTGCSGARQRAAFTGPWTRRLAYNHLARATPNAYLVEQKLDILRSLGGRIDEHIERSAVESRKKRAGRGARIRLTRNGPGVTAHRVDDPDAPEGSLVSGDEPQEAQR